jgi:hypothetical protein
MIKNKFLTVPVKVDIPVTCYDFSELADKDRTYTTAEIEEILKSQKRLTPLIIKNIVDMSVDKEKQLNVALNKISGNWDDEKLSYLLSEFDKEDIEIIGFEVDEVESLLKSFSQQKEDSLGDFLNKEINLDDFEEKNFDCKCPKCGFLFDRYEE